MALFKVRDKYRQKRAFFIRRARHHLAESRRLRDCGDRFGARHHLALARRCLERVALWNELIQDVVDAIEDQRQEHIERDAAIHGPWGAPSPPFPS